jgi:hypothetical protein
MKNNILIAPMMDWTEGVRIQFQNQRDVFFKYLFDAPMTPREFSRIR